MEEDEMAEPRTILIVEDSPAQALALGQVLEREGLQVFWAPDGKKGVSMAQQHLPDAILLDVEMPGMDGSEVCKRLQETAQTASIPIVMLTVHTDPAIVKDLFDQGAVDFVPKDAYSTKVLLETLRQLKILDGVAVRENWGADE
jgi:CheY-like chemotaxis protein